MAARMETQQNYLAGLRLATAKPNREDRPSQGTDLAAPSQMGGQGHKPEARRMTCAKRRLLPNGHLVERPGPVTTKALREPVFDRHSGRRRTPADAR